MKKLAKISAFFFILLVISFVLYNKYYNKVQIELVERNEMDKIIHTKGIVFKNDRVTKFNSDADTEFYYQEGKKISSGVKIAGLDVSGYSMELNNQIKLIEKAIDELSSLVVIEPDDKNYYLNYSKEELDILNKRYIKAMKEGYIDFYSPCAGFLSYKYDGLEEICDLDVILEEDKLKDFDFSILDEINSESEMTMNKPSDFLFKVSESFEYYVAIKVNTSDILSLKEGVFLRVKLEGNDSVFGQIYRLMPSNEQEKSIMILKFDDFFYEVYDKRIVDTKVITNSYDGLIIPTKSLVNLYDMQGVYIVDVSKIVKFLPVNVLYSNEDKAIVSMGESMYEGVRGTIYVNDKPYKTIMQYDKVVLEPSNVYDGKIIEREWSDDN